jgi:hypothetical protein
MPLFPGRRPLNISDNVSDIMNILLPVLPNQGPSRRARCRRLSLLLLAFLSLSPGIALANPQPAPAGTMGRPGSALPCPSAIGTSYGTAVLADGWWSQTSKFCLSHLRSRQGMVQFGAVGMLIALGIIWWRK